MNRKEPTNEADLYEEDILEEPAGVPRRDFLRLMANGLIGAGLGLGLSDATEAQTRSGRRPPRGRIGAGGRFYGYSGYRPIGQYPYAHSPYFRFGRYYGILGPQHVAHLVPFPIYGRSGDNKEIRELREEVEKLKAEHGDLENRRMDMEETRQYVAGLLETMRDRELIGSFNTHVHEDVDYDFEVSRAFANPSINQKYHLEIGRGAAIARDNVLFRRIGVGQFPIEVTKDIYHALGYKTR